MRRTSTSVDFETLRPGMEVQLARRAEAIAAGMPARGWKIGINVKAVQAHFGLSEPCIGWLDGRRVLASGSQVDFLPEAGMRIEPEVCLRVGPGAKLEAVAPAFELVDYTTPPANLFSLLSSSIIHVATVVGVFAPPERAEGLGSKWPRMEVTGQPPTAIAEGLVPEDLQQSVDFVAARLADFGLRLEPGDLILAGSFAAGVPPFERGARAEADFGPLGRVSVSRRA